MKLWEKGYALDQLVEVFMTGDDPFLDKILISYDCFGSIAHAKMLEKIGILSFDECHQLVRELGYIIQQAAEGVFIISLEDEDVHTAIENALIKKIGDTGKKLHTARSRNDQILVDMRMYMRDYILKIGQELLTTCYILCEFAQLHHDVPIPGRTHFQRAMPSSLGLWAGAFSESLLDNFMVLQNCYDLINQSPLGSAASYGVSIAIDRQYCAYLLGFERVQNNVLYANNSRGKFEAAVLHGLVQIMNDLSKIATDIIIFSTPEFGYLILPEKFCPGSSLMPQKRNPCSLELIRAKSATVQGLLFQNLEIIRALPSGYNRDFQETKRPIMKGFEIVYESLVVFGRIFSEICVDRESCLNSFTSELFATDEVLRLSTQGVPFRDAYKKVAKQLNDMCIMDSIENILLKKHQGATGNLGIDMSLIKLKEYKEWIDTKSKKWDDVRARLTQH